MNLYIYTQLHTLKILYVTSLKAIEGPYFFLIDLYVLAYSNIPHISASGSNIPHVLHLKTLLTFRVYI